MKISDFLGISIFLILLMGIPMLPCALIWWFLSPVAFIETFLTLILCIFIYIPCWILNLIFLAAIFR